jgi:hypothetical protein
MNPDDIPEALAASALTMLYCAQPGVWEMFEGWLRDSHYLREEERLASPGHLAGYAEIIAALTREVQAEVLGLQFEDYLEDARDST